MGSAVQAGATVRTGGKRGKGYQGFFYEPTVLTGVTQNMDVIRQEIFGPVIPVVEFDDLDQAIAYANDSDFGLTSSIYTKDLNVALRACHVKSALAKPTSIARTLRPCKDFMRGGGRAASAELMENMGSMSSCRHMSCICRAIS